MELEEPKDEMMKIQKIIASYGVVETILWNRYYYQVPVMARTIISTFNKHQIYNSMLQDFSIGRGNCTIKDGSICSCFIDMGSPVKTKV